MTMGIGRKARRARSGEIAVNAMPTYTTLLNVRISSLAPKSRKRSSWFTSSLRIDMSPPEVWSSK